jgi:fimbrial chaperone protein
MFRFVSRFLGLTLACAFGPAQAASLQVAPVLLDVQAAGDAATSITLRNPSNAPLNAQLRVYRWTQVDGREVLSETRDVAASPPAVMLKPNSDYTVRVVRLTRTPIVGEESYRLLADEIPDEKTLKAGAVNLVVRQSIPVFFRAPTAAPANVTWTGAKANGRLSIKASNTGDLRMRVTRLHVADKAGEVSNFGDGLVGYVLGHSSSTWTSRGAVKGFAGGAAKLTAVSETGPLESSVQLR